jgi:hypothetical protein
VNIWIKREEKNGAEQNCNMEHHNSNSSPNIIRIIKDDEMVRICNTHGREAKCIQIFGGKAGVKETTRKT